MIVTLLNLSLSDRYKALLSTLVGASFGYLLPNPALKWTSHQLPEKRENKPVYCVAAEQQLDGLHPVQHGVAIHYETE